MTLAPLEERFLVDRLGDALILRPRGAGPLVLTRDDVARLRHALEAEPSSAETLRRRLKADIGEATKADACGTRRTTRAPKRNARRRRA
mgnify:CR=1 FL=1